MIAWIILFALIGLIPAAIAKNKGRAFVPWWFYGFLLFPVALPHALIMKTDRGQLERQRTADEGLRKCPSCAELVKEEALICRYCQQELPPTPASTSTPASAPAVTAPASAGPLRQFYQTSGRDNTSNWMFVGVIALVAVVVLIIAIARR